MSALLTPAIAIAVALIAYRQWRTAQNRLKLDLFDRRLAIHTQALVILERAIATPLEPVDLLSFQPAMRQSKWLLGKDIQLYFKNEFIQHLLEFDIAWANRQSTDAERKRLFKWVADQEDVLDAKFDRYLNINP